MIIYSHNNNNNKNKKYSTKILRNNLWRKSWVVSLTHFIFAEKKQILFGPLLFQNQIRKRGGGEGVLRPRHCRRHKCIKKLVGKVWTEKARFSHTSTFLLPNVYIRILLEKITIRIIRGSWKKYSWKGVALIIFH